MSNSNPTCTLYYIILLHAATLLALAFVCIPLLINHKRAYFTAPLAGIGGLLMLHYFAKSYRWLPVLAMLIPLVLLTVLALLFLKEYTPQMISIIWLNILVGSTAIKLTMHISERTKKKHTFSFSRSNSSYTIGRENSRGSR